VALTIWTSRSALRLTEAADQALNRDLAREIAPEVQPHLRTRIDDEALKPIFSELMEANRRVDVYLLGSNGMIKGAYVDPGVDVQLQTVDVGPLDRLMAGEPNLPVLGDDPTRPGRKRPFSVAPVSIMGESGCYLYLTLGSDRYDSALAMMQQAFIGRGALKALPLILLLTAVAGLALFAVVTRPLRRVTRVVQAFERGDHDRRVAVTTGDEVGHLGAAFNRMADTLVEHIEALERNDRLRRELVANVSHDLRSPLASIQGYLETVLMKAEELDPAERERYLDVVLRNTQRLSRLVEELFELSRFDAQQVEPVVEAFSVAELVQDVAAQFAPRAERTGVTLEAVLHERLPPVYGDIGLIERVIANLTDNAIRHTDAGGRVELAPYLDEGRVVVRVADTGPGIPEAQLQRIFERFYQVDEARTWVEGGGAGLGLAIAKQILDLHGCQIWVESAEGEGTAFFFSLPTKEAPLAPRRPAPGPPARPLARPS
ncbi:MAG: HAMP domain-containing sensor histidine kinase, partial [Rhodothermales bacterium]|nr:HAMP domain-containing sensor histidine kinase [Rhodothermales bacterium]